MIKHEIISTYQDFFEYHGNTELSRIRKQKGASVMQDRLIFDSDYNGFWEELRHPPNDAEIKGSSS